MTKATIYTQDAKKKGDITLPDVLFAQPWNESLVHQVVVAMQANARTSVAHTKNRGEVRGGGKKPWQQKGTGRARHGSTRSPIWVGGGVTFGPRNEKVFGKQVNKKMRSKALASVISRKLHDGEILFVDTLTFSGPKSSEALVSLKALSKIEGFDGLVTKRNNAALIALANTDLAVVKSFSNFGNVEIDEVRNLNPMDLLQYKYLIIVAPEESIQTLEKRVSGISVSVPVEEKKPAKKVAKKVASKKVTA